MVREISNGRQVVKLYHSVNRGKAMYQLAYYAGGRRVQKNFSDKSEAKRVAKQILGELSNDADAVGAMATPELESLIAARRVLAPNYALHVAVEEHAQAIAKLGKATLREAVEFFLRHNRLDVVRLTLAEVADHFAKSREQSGLSAHYVSQCRKIVGDLARAFPGQTLPDLKTAELEAWLGGLPLAQKTKNGMRIILVACGNWAEGRGYLIKGGSPFPAMVRYKETKSAVAIFTPENITDLLTKADNTLRPFLALGAFAGLRMAELQRLDWKDIDLDRGFITVDASKAKTRQRRLVPISDNLEALADTMQAGHRVGLRASTPANRGGKALRGYSMAGEWPAPFVHLVPAGHSPRHGAGRVGSGQFAGSHLQPLQGIGHAGDRESVVCSNSIIRKLTLASP